jgi:hypothetical protein
MSACINLPDGRTAFMFDRPKISSNSLASGDLGWTIVEPWRISKVSYHGEVLLLDDAWVMKPHLRPHRERVRTSNSSFIQAASSRLWVMTKTTLA